jgi:hypothetical protein
MSTSTTIKEVMRALAALEDPKMREANERRGDDHGVNLTHLRSLAKRVKTQHELALQLWATGDTAARLLATLVCKPKAFSRFISFSIWSSNASRSRPSACPETVGHESLPRRDWHSSSKTSQASNLDGRAARCPHRLPCIAWLHAALRTDLDRRDGSSTRGVGKSMTAP